MPAPSARALIATYLCGFFSLSLLQMSSLATPLLGNALGMSAVTIGILAGSRSVAPLAYSIHIGALMDVVGVRRVMILFAVLCAVLPPLYPLTSSFGVLVTLQVLMGLSTAVVWLAAQTAIARVGGGDPRYTGRFSFITVIGTVAGPMLLGLAWQFGEVWSGYGLISLWGVLLVASALLFDTAKVTGRRRLHLRDIVPDLSSYARAWQLLRRPVTAFVIACTFLRLASFGIVETFYPLLLQMNGLSPAVIGTLVAIGNLASSPAALAAGLWIKLCRSEAASLVASLLVSIVALAVVPALDTVWMLALSMIVFGFGQGVSLPLILIMLARSVSADEQGITAGLRGTVNRLAAFVLPVVMGIIAQVAGVEASFWIMGALLLTATLLTALLGRRL